MCCSTFSHELLNVFNFSEVYFRRDICRHWNLHGTEVKWNYCNSGFKLHHRVRSNLLVGVEKHELATNIAACFCSLTIPISLFHTFEHLNNFRKPKLQAQIIRIIWMVFKITNDRLNNNICHRFLPFLSKAYFQSHFINIVFSFKWYVKFTNPMSFTASWDTYCIILEMTRELLTVYQEKHRMLYIIRPLSVVSPPGR